MALAATKVTSEICYSNKIHPPSTSLELVATPEKSKFHYAEASDPCLATAPTCPLGTQRKLSRMIPFAPHNLPSLPQGEGHVHPADLPKPWMQSLCRPTLFSQFAACHYGRHKAHRFRTQVRPRPNMYVRGCRFQHPNDEASSKLLIPQRPLNRNKPAAFTLKPKPVEVAKTLIDPSSSGGSGSRGRGSQ